VRWTEPLRLHPCLYYCEHFTLRYGGRAQIGRLSRFLLPAVTLLFAFGWSVSGAIRPIGTVLLRGSLTRSRPVPGLLLQHVT
jgi:hypothetical protein